MFLIPLRLTAAAAAALDAEIHKRILGPGVTTLIISTEEMDIKKINKDKSDLQTNLIYW